jgi:broad specificity phosphatase PhoE
VPPITLIRHAQALNSADVPGAEWPLSNKGRQDARTFGELRCRSIAPTLVLTSPERRARETAALAFPAVPANIQDDLSEVKRPWYASANDHETAVASFLRCEAVTGWEPHQDVIARIKRVTRSLQTWDRPVIVSHGVFLTTWLDHELGLDDPFLFWSNLRLPDAWELNPEKKSFNRIS